MHGKRDSNQWGAIRDALSGHHSIRSLSMAPHKQGDKGARIVNLAR